MFKLKENKKCKYCLLEFQSGEYIGKYAAHVKKCLYNPTNSLGIGRDKYGHLLYEKECKICQKTFIGVKRKTVCDSKECKSKNL